MGERVGAEVGRVRGPQVRETVGEGLLGGRCWF